MVRRVDHGLFSLVAQLQSTRVQEYRRVVCIGSKSPSIELKLGLRALVGMIHGTRENYRRDAVRIRSIEELGFSEDIIRG